MKAKKKTLNVLPLAELGVDTTAHFDVVATAPPAKRSRGIMVNDVTELVQVLSNKELI